MIDRGFWRGRRVLVTGHTGFKGSWLSLWLARCGAQVTGLALPPTATPNLHSLARVGDHLSGHSCDVRDAEATDAVVRAAKPEVVFHLAAQALVRVGYREPVTTFATNVMGTVNVLDALRSLDGVRAVVVVTTDKVYRNHEWVHPYREPDELGGTDPYGASKAASELVVSSYRQAFCAMRGLALASARAGNVVGGGDWSEDRLLPDAVRAWSRNEVLQLRNPKATRPWQHVLEPLAGYLVLAQRLWHEPALAEAWNFAPAAEGTADVATVVGLAAACWPGARVHHGSDDPAAPEAGWLALDGAKARMRLGIRPVWTLTQTVQRTMHWYRAQRDGTSARDLCEGDIRAYEAALG